MEEIIGKNFNKLTVISKYDDYFLPCKRVIHRYLCRCVCGNEVVVMKHSITSGHTRSCGCARKIKNRYDLSGDYGIGYTQKEEAFYFDKEDYEKIKDYCWGVSNEGYLVNSAKRKIFHRMVMGEPKNKVIDHINHNKLDNRKSNLRTCTHQQNCMNSIKPKNNTSGTVGVYYNKETKKWRARLMIQNHSIHLGYFNDFEEAKKQRKLAEEKYYGEYAFKFN